MLIEAVIRAPSRSSGTAPKPFVGRKKTTPERQRGRSGRGGEGGRDAAAAAAAAAEEEEGTSNLAVTTGGAWEGRSRESL